MVETLKEIIECLEGIIGDLKLDRADKDPPCLVSIEYLEHCADALREINKKER